MAAPLDEDEGRIGRRLGLLHCVAALHVVCHLSSRSTQFGLLVDIYKKSYPHFTVGRVLIVEDDRDIAQLVREICTEIGEHEARVAENGATAVDEAMDWSPDVILLDLFMLPVDGWEVARRLRVYPVTAAIPVVVMSALGSVHERATEIGTPWSIAKPFTIEMMLHVLEQVLDAHPAA